MRKYPRPTILANGTIIYPARGEPPPEMEGYKRVGFEFQPLYPLCDKRERRILEKPCGAINVTMICRHADCVMQGERVLAADCKDCEFASQASGGVTL